MDLAEVLEVASRTDPGRVRPHNEDAVFASAELGLAVLADGMGGYQAGEVASRMAVDLLAAGLGERIPACRPQEVEAGSGCRRAHRLIAEQVTAANAAVYGAAQSHAEYAGMGTTLVMAWFYGNRVSVAHIGDSRLYRLRGREFQQLTRDHSLLQEQLDNGMITPAQARFAGNRNLVTRALGIDPEVEAEINECEVAPGDIYLLCSDGLNDMVEDGEIAETLVRLADDPEQAAEQLVQLANDNGGRDNVSVILVKIKGDFTGRQGWWQKLLARCK